MTDEKVYKIITTALAATLVVAIPSTIYNTTVDFLDAKEKQEQSEKPSNQEFEPYEHVFYRRYELLNPSKDDTSSITEGQVEIPEGYEILEIENYTDTKGRGSVTRGFDVWFTNTETVTAEATYNEVTRQYEYSTPGKVVNSKEETPQQKVKQ